MSDLFKTHVSVISQRDPVSLQARIRGNAAYYKQINWVIQIGNHQTIYILLILNLNGVMHWNEDCTTDLSEIC